MAFQRLLLATRKGVLAFDHGSGGWSRTLESFSGSHAAYVFLDQRSGHLFACLSDGHFGTKLHRWKNFASEKDLTTVDAREKWEELTAPAYPSDAKLANGQDAVLKYPWSMAAGSDNQPGRLYFGSEPGGLFQSDDDGDSFQIVSGLWDHPSRLDPDLPWMGGGLDNPAIHSICVDPRDDRSLRVGMSVAGVFQSDDAGQSWRPTNRGSRADFLPNPDVEVGHDPHLLVQCASNPDVLWQQNHCGIFRSTDGGQQWSDVSEKSGPANFGFAVAVDPQDGDTAWVVPAEADMVRAAVERKLCVCRTTDGGRTWQAFRSGLPQVDCYDFVFRHSLVYHDEQLVFGTACGSLYLSEDRGESWNALAHHLPPIYSIAVQ